MSKGYRIYTTSPATPGDAEDLGQFLAQYEIDASVTVYQILRDGRRVRDNALERTVKDVTASGTAGGIAGFMAGGLLGTILGPFALTLALPSLVSLPINILGLHKANKRTPGHPDATHSEIVLKPQNVSEDRRGWFEYLVNRWVTVRGWQVRRLTHRKAAAGARAQRDPRPWRERNGRERC